MNIFRAPHAVMQSQLTIAPQTGRYACINFGTFVLAVRLLGIETEFVERLVGCCTRCSNASGAGDASTASAHNSTTMRASSGCACAAGWCTHARGYACIHMQVQLLQQRILRAMYLQPSEGDVAGLLEDGLQDEADGPASEQSKVVNIFAQAASNLLPLSLSLTL